MKQTFVILTPGFPANEEDTTCLPAVQQFVLSLKKTQPQFKLQIVAFQYPFKKEQYKWCGIPVTALGGCNKPGAMRILTWFKAYQSLQKLNKKEQIVGILSLWLTECALIGKWFSKNNRLKHLMWIHGQDAKKSNQYIKRIRPESEEVIAISKFTSDLFFQNFNIRPFMIAQNGIQPEIFPDISPQNTYDVLGVGSLIPLKRYGLFLEIIKDLKKTKPDIKAAIAGKGVLKSELEIQIQKSGLKNNVTLLDEVSHTEVLNLMSQSSIFLHTSEYEGNSTVLIEALYSGCQVFSSCELTDEKIENFTLSSTKEEFVKNISELVEKKKEKKRVLFNNMDTTAHQIVQQFL